MSIAWDGFCDRCAPLARNLGYDPAATFHAEMMSGSCIWSDETCRGWCLRCASATRFLFRARYDMTVGEPVSPDVQDLWDRTAKQFPTWPLFRPERRAPGLATEVRRMVDAMNAEFLDGI